MLYYLETRLLCHFFFNIVNNLLHVFQKKTTDVHVVGMGSDGPIFFKLHDDEMNTSLSQTPLTSSTSKQNHYLESSSRKPF